MEGPASLVQIYMALTRTEIKFTRSIDIILVILISVLVRVSSQQGRRCRFEWVWGKTSRHFIDGLQAFMTLTKPFIELMDTIFLSLTVFVRILIIRSRGGFYSRQKPHNLHITAICSAIIHFQSNHALQRSESEMPYRWIETMARKQ